MSAAISHDPAPTDGLEVYQVGGSVRDELLGLPVSDRDYVVVGSTPDEMIRRGFVSVGKDFPVFLHPQTHEEYALARTERKTAPGYHGFVFDANPDVTLEEDLSRRDLTINAMAVDHSGQLIDPYNGRLDLAQGTLRHVSEAFVEDPVRVLRLARFATRFEDFVVAPTTLSLCQAMVVAGELDALVPERVWTELALALMYHKPSRFFTVLRDAHALAVVWPQLSAAMDHEAFWQAMQAMDVSAHQQASLESRFALLCRAMSLEDVKASCAQLKVPNRCRQWAVWANVHLAQLMDLTDQTPEQILNFVQSFDGLRQPDRLDGVAMMAKAYGRSSNKSNAMDAALGFLEEVMEALASLDPTPWVAQGLAGPDMGAAIEAERQALIAKVQKRSA